jgi:hypothetical protein
MALACRVFSTETRGTCVHKRGDFLHSPSLLGQWWLTYLWLNSSFSLMHSRSLKKDWWFYENITNSMEQSPCKVHCSSAQDILQLLGMSPTKMIRLEICNKHGTCRGIMSSFTWKMSNWKCSREVFWSSGIWWYCKISIMMKSTIFWDIMLYSSLSVNWRFRGTYHLQHVAGGKLETQCTARCYIPEDGTLHNHHGENLTSYTALWYSDSSEHGIEYE